MSKAILGSLAASIACLLAIAFFCGRQMGRVEGEKMGVALALQETGNGMITINNENTLFFESVSRARTMSGSLSSKPDFSYKVSYIKPAWYANTFYGNNKDSNN